MRAYRASIFLTAFLTVLYLGRYHLIDLSRTLVTYLSFHEQLISHPDEVYRHSNSTTNQRDPWPVPRIIHHIFLTDGRSVSHRRHDPTIASCKRFHEDWEHIFWTDESASAFMQQYYPQLWPHYLSYRRTVQRANILRYALLDHFGGVYLDLDLTCLQPLDELMRLPWLAPAAHPTGVSNGFMISRPGHPFMKHVLANAPASDLSWGLPYIETMLSTGCMFLSNQFMMYTKFQSNGAGFSGAISTPLEDRLYVLADKYGNTSPHRLNGLATTPLFRHGGLSSWHEWDAWAFVLIGEHCCYFLAMVVLGALCSICMVWWSQKRRCDHRDYRHLCQREKAIVRSSEDEDWIV